MPALAWRAAQVNNLEREGLAVDEGQPASQPSHECNFECESTKKSPASSSSSSKTGTRYLAGLRPSRRSTQFNPHKWAASSPAGSTAGAVCWWTSGFVDYPCQSERRRASNRPEASQASPWPRGNRQFSHGNRDREHGHATLGIPPGPGETLAGQPWAPAPYDDGAGLDGGWEGLTCLSCWRYRRTRDGMTLFDGTSSR